MKSMNKKRMLRLMRHLMYDKPKITIMYRCNDSDRVWEDAKLVVSLGATPEHCQTDEFLDDYTKIGVLAMSLGMTKEEMDEEWSKKTIARGRNRDVNHNKMPKVTNRDNKKEINHGSGWQGNTIRYPSKKRPRTTWARFYKLFPHLAERDGWNGKTSSKYDGQNKQKKSK
jgi:hypothetical protein